MDAAVNKGGEVNIVGELPTVNVPSARHPQRRLVIICRDDGLFSYAEQYWCRSEYESEVIAEGWRTLITEGLYATSEIAEREARAAFKLWYPKDSSG